MQDATSLPYGDSAAHVAMTAWTAPREMAAALNADLGPRSVAVAVYANHGRWIVECPDCRGAQLAHPVDQRFMCNSCANAAVGGLWRPTLWPKNRADIESALHVRPVEARNWINGETVAHLRAENKSRGV